MSAPAPSEPESRLAMAAAGFLLKRAADILEPLKNAWKKTSFQLPTRDRELLEQKTDETILYLVTVPHPFCLVNRQRMHLLRMIITTQNVYRVQHQQNALYLMSPESGCGYSWSGEKPMQFPQPYCLSVYSFHEPLRMDDIELLGALNRVDPRWDADEFPVLASLYDRLVYRAPVSGGGTVETVKVFDAARVRESRRKFESVVRRIPGRFAHGEWEALDGFFGLFYHPGMRELTEFPV